MIAAATPVVRGKILFVSHSNEVIRIDICIATTLGLLSCDGAVKRLFCELPSLGLCIVMKSIW